MWYSRGWIMSILRVSVWSHLHWKNLNFSALAAFCICGFWLLQQKAWVSIKPQCLSSTTLSYVAYIRVYNKAKIIQSLLTNLKFTLLLGQNEGGFLVLTKIRQRFILLLLLSMKFRNHHFAHFTALLVFFVLALSISERDWWQNEIKCRWCASI